jgi:hypothetical protein
MMKTLGNLTQTMDTQMRNQTELAAAINERHSTGIITYEKFLKLNPPTFSVNADPELAESWIAETERAFWVLPIPDEKQTDFGIYRLTEDAQKWGDTTRTIHFAGMDPIPWEAVKETFLETYFPQHARDQKQQEFLKLTQGNMNLVEYTTKFQTLERYCPNLFANDKARATKYVRGLKDGLRPRVMINLSSTLAKAIEVATVLSKEWERSRKGQNDTPWKQGAGPQQHHGGKKYQPPHKKQRYNGGARPPQHHGQNRVCQKCNRSHYGQPCPRDTGACLYCGKMGHYARQCHKKIADMQKENAEGGYQQQQPPQPQPVPHHNTQKKVQG